MPCKTKFETKKNFSFKLGGVLEENTKSEFVFSEKKRFGLGFFSIFILFAERIKFKAGEKTQKFSCFFLNGRT